MGAHNYVQKKLVQVVRVKELADLNPYPSTFR
jgi:hypothetical protein